MINTNNTATIVTLFVSLVGRVKYLANSPEVDKKSSTIINEERKLDIWLCQT